MTIYNSNRDIRESGAEVDEYLDAGNLDVT